MRRRLVLGVVLGLVAALGWTFVNRPLPVPKATLDPLPAAPVVDGVTFSVLRGANMKSQHGFSVRGGSLTTPFISSLAAFLVEHPRGRLLIDAGVARAVDDHLQTISWLMRAVASLEVVQPTIDALAERGIEPADLRGIVLTHSHWDHVSGLADLRGVPVWITGDELAHARSEDDGGTLYRQLEADASLDLRDLEFEEVPYGPFERSHDVFGDSSVVVVPLAGHTPGSVGVFVTTSSKQRYFVIGDTSWTREGVTWPAEKPWLSRRMVDHDAQAVRQQLVFLHQLEAANPELIIVPAHDARVHEEIAK